MTCSITSSFLHDFYLCLCLHLLSLCLPYELPQFLYPGLRIPDAAAVLLLAARLQLLDPSAAVADDLCPEHSGKYRDSHG